MRRRGLELPTCQLLAVFDGAIRERPLQRPRIRQDHHGRAPRDSGSRKQAALGGAPAAGATPRHYPGASGDRADARHTIPRGEAHEGGTKQRADKSQTEKNQQAAKPETKQLRGGFGVSHSCHAEKRCQMRHRLGDVSGASIMLFFVLVHAAVRFRKKSFHPKGRQWKESTTDADGHQGLTANVAAAFANGPRQSFLDIGDPGPWSFSEGQRRIRPPPSRPT